MEPPSFSVTWSLAPFLSALTRNALALSLTVLVPAARNGADFEVITPVGPARATEPLHAAEQPMVTGGL